ncbi:hypothetical protein GCM10009665_58730 [Kitasatospora nipponensis]|uniref:Uncharacterized protein n=1 Tax=Kitasatospora nipponensis TaxID=258049 RepID=A0ABN1WUC1_9ACTN
MPTGKIRRPALTAAVAALGALTALTLAGPVPAEAATTPATAPATVSASPGVAPTAFVDLPTTALPTDRAPHEISFQYRNDSPGDQLIAPQILIESPVTGPSLDPAAVSLQVETADGHWLPLPLGVQTGTLYTDLIPARLVLHSGHTLTEHYRLTVLRPAQGTIAPRVALYG